MGISFTQGLIRGLRSDSRIPPNTDVMTTYFGLRATEFGAGPFTEISNPFDPSYAIKFPFPQVFKGKGVTLLCTETRIFTVDESDWSVQPLLTYDIYNVGTPKPIVAGDGPWQFVDFHNTWFLLNGRTMVFKTLFPFGGASTATSLTSTEAFLQDDYATPGTTITTACAFRGRMVSGGFDTSNYWNSDWQTQWNAGMSQAITYGFSLAQPGQNWVGWSNIGGGDLLHTFLPSLALGNVGSVTGGHDSTIPFYLDVGRRVQNGFMPMDWQGRVRNLAPLRNQILACGDDGISIIFPSTIDVVGSHIPTFGHEEDIIPTGLASRNAIGGGPNKKVLLDGKGTLWSVTSDLQINRLGFEEHFEQMLGNEIIISHDPNYDEYYISDKNVCFLQSPAGLSQCPQIVTSVLRGIDSKGDHLLLGIASAPSDLVELDTNLFSSLKPIQEVEVIGKNIEGLEVDVFSIIQGEGKLISSAVIDSFGKARVTGAGTELTISISGESRPNLHISAINVVFKDATKLGLKEFIDV